MRLRISTGLLVVALVAASDVTAQEPSISKECITLPTRDCVLAMAQIPGGDLAGIETLLNVFDAQIELGSLTAAARTVDRMKMATANLKDDEQRRNKLSGLAILDTVLLAAAQAGNRDVARALKTMASISEQAEESGYISLLFASLAAGHAKAGRATAAMDVMQVALTLAAAVKDDARRLTQADIAVKYAAVQSETGYISEARMTAAGLQGNMRKIALSQIAEAQASAQARAGETAKALEIAAAIDNDLARVLAYCAVAEAHVHAGRPTEAVEAMMRAMAAASSLAQMDERARALARIARTYVKAGKLADAMAVAVGVKDDVWRIVALEVVAARAPN